jgi:hypothetical protein
MKPAAPTPLHLPNDDDPPPALAHNRPRLAARPPAGAPSHSRARATLSVCPTTALHLQRSPTTGAHSAAHGRPPTGAPSHSRARHQRPLLRAANGYITGDEAPRPSRPLRLLEDGALPPALAHNRQRSVARPPVLHPIHRPETPSPSARGRRSTFGAHPQLALAQQPVPIRPPVLHPIRGPDASACSFARPTAAVDAGAPPQPTATRAPSPCLDDTAASPTPQGPLSLPLPDGNKSLYFVFVGRVIFLSILDCF